MYPAASIRAAHTALLACRPGAAPACAAEVEAPGAGEGGCLLLEVGVLGRVGVEDGLEDAEELGVFGEGVWGRGYARCGAEGEGEGWRRGGEEGEDGC